MYSQIVLDKKWGNKRNKHKVPTATQEHVPVVAENKQKPRIIEDKKAYRSLDKQQQGKPTSTFNVLNDHMGRSTRNLAHILIVKSDKLF